MHVEVNVAAAARRAPPPRTPADVDDAMPPNDFVKPKRTDLWAVGAVAAASLAAPDDIGRRCAVMVCVMGGCRGTGQDPRRSAAWGGLLQIVRAAREDSAPAMRKGMAKGRVLARCKTVRSAASDGAIGRNWA
jgi:hypothetical protein